MSDIQTPEQPTQVESTQPTGTAQDQARNQLYTDYAKLYQTPPEPEPEAPQEPVVEPTTPAAPAAIDVQAILASQQTMIAELQNQLNSLNKPAEPVVTPTPTSDTAKKAAMEEFVSMLAAGDYTKAEDYLFEFMAPRLQQKLQPQIVQQSVEQSNAERDITQFITTFENDNSDLMPMREYVVMGAEKRLANAQNEGKIKSTADFVREYKAAVTEEAKLIRDKFQISRAAGKQDAMTTQRTVLSATTMEPSGIQQPPNKTSQVVVPTTVDYIQQRRDKMAGIMGMR